MLSVSVQPRAHFFILSFTYSTTSDEATADICYPWEINDDRRCADHSNNWTRCLLHQRMHCCQVVALSDGFLVSMSRKNDLRQYPLSLRCGRGAGSGASAVGLILACRKRLLQKFGTERLSFCGKKSFFWGGAELKNSSYCLTEKFSFSDFFSVKFEAKNPPLRKSFEANFKILDNCDNQLLYYETKYRNARK